MNMKFDLPKAAEKQLAKIWKEHITEVRFTPGTTTPFPIVVFAMANDIHLGYYLAVKSGMNHRIPHRLWAERVCGAETLSVINKNTPRGNEQVSSFVSEEELTRDYEPYWLGDHPSTVFAKGVLPANPLFVYPENYLVPKKEREFVSELCKRTYLKLAVIITKSSVMLSDFPAPCICVM